MTDKPRRFRFSLITLLVAVNVAGVLVWANLSWTRGAVLENINDGYSGRAPDLGALEHGAAAPHYGPRPAVATE